jgi:hypothetical protein
VPEALQPAVDVLQRGRVDRVHAAGALGADGREAGLPQHPQVLRDARLGDPELVLDDRGDGTRRLLAVGQQLQDPAPDRIAEDVERVHAGSIAAAAYISRA